MKLCTIVGARPQFIKAATISRAIAEHNRLIPDSSHIKEVIIHTGQHYDDMSVKFFQELEIPEPGYHLKIGSGSHGQQTADMLAAIERALIKEQPDWVLVYGDTNTTLAGALAAAKLHIKIAHIEAGLRSFNREMPEEINRIVTDHLSTLLLCPSRTAVNNLKSEGIRTGVELTGDVMFDALQYALTKTPNHPAILHRLNLKAASYLLATVHRPENTDDSRRLRNIMIVLSELAEQETVVFPIHPRTKKMLDNSLSLRSELNPALKIIGPIGYFDMIALQQAARMILTDSGGMQKEAYWLKVPCLTLRDETEWVETVDIGWNILTCADRQKIVNELRHFTPPTEHPSLYGDGHAGKNIVNAFLEWNYK
jgi:UDP-GlcNAc3NAcA epimerase